MRQRDRGKLTCRERIDLLFDEGSFREVGSLAGFASYDEDGRIAAFSPANHVGGSGTIEGRPAIVCADDFTSRGGHADGAIGAKSFHLDQLSMQLQIPSIRLLDGSSGGGSVAAMVPEQKKEGESNAQESSGALSAGKPRVTRRRRVVPARPPRRRGVRPAARGGPVVNVLLGSVVGIGAAKAVLGHFSVMVRDISQLFVAGPPVVSHAMGYDITKEDLGGWHVHCTNGSVDNLVETEEEAIDVTQALLVVPARRASSRRRPSSPPPIPPTGARTSCSSIVPRKRTTTFDVRRAIELMVDRGSWFEIGALWGTDQVVGLARFDGRPVGVLATDSRHVNGGAMTADGCDKLTRHLDLCDLFHIPVVNLVDNPGFCVGLEHERNGTIRKGATWMVAMAQVQVPIFTVIMRRSFGVSGNHQATPTRQPNVRVSWPAADVGGIPPEGGIEAAYKRQLAEAADPVALRAELERPHRERPRPDRPAQPLPDGGADRPPRHPPPDLRVDPDGDEGGHGAAAPRQPPAGLPALSVRSHPSIPVPSEYVVRAWPAAGTRTARDTRMGISRRPGQMRSTRSVDRTIDGAMAAASAITANPTTRTTAHPRSIASASPPMPGSIAATSAATPNVIDAKTASSPRSRRQAGDGSSSPWPRRRRRRRGDRLLRRPRRLRARRRTLRRRPSTAGRSGGPPTDHRERCHRHHHQRGRRDEQRAVVGRQHAGRVGVVAGATTSRRPRPQDGARRRPSSASLATSRTVGWPCSSTWPATDGTCSCPVA